MKVPDGPAAGLATSEIYDTFSKMQFSLGVSFRNRFEIWGIRAGCARDVSRPVMGQDFRAAQTLDLDAVASSA